MWLLPWLGPVARTAANVYYRLTVTGAALPPGPLLLVANHPNGLIDPMLVSAAARRPLRYLAKAPLVTGRFGWLFRSVGSIPVYRQQDDPSQMERNADSLREAEAALQGGAAIALFPEGISHDSPSLTSLKTGAARIALGAAAKGDTPISIVPVGLVLRDKPAFRSEAHVIVGDPVEWGDLASRGASDQEAVRTLTSRIEEGLRAVTVNL